MKFSIIFVIAIVAMIGMVSPSVLVVYAYDGPTIDLDKIMEKRVLQIDQKCIGTSEIKFYEITMESVLMENNSIVVINYLSPIILFLFIISFLFININFIKDRFKN